MEYVCIKNFIKINFSGNNAFLFTAKVKDILSIYYVAVRGRDNVEGAVQRVLNKRRISSIKDFVLEGNTFFNTFIFFKTYPIIMIMTNVNDLINTSCIFIPSFILL